MQNDMFSPPLFPTENTPPSKTSSSASTTPSKSTPISTNAKNTSFPSSAAAPTPVAIEDTVERKKNYLVKESLFTVSSLTDAIKQDLESNYQKIKVEGEISNFKLHSSGHWYFSLKDRGAQISCALFRASAAKLKQPPKDGDQVIATGKVSLFAPRGQYQLIATHLEKKGLGDLLAELERLKLELKDRGWFDKDKKKPLPALPKVIGVVTSETGAALQDMINVLSHRNLFFHLLLYPVHVQGEVAAGEIAHAIETFNQEKLCDVIIVGRGGGAYEDLMAFNDLRVLTAIHRCEIPVISAVGHETDFTLSDFVADHRAPTPSAAAERVMASAKERADRLIAAQKELHVATRHCIESIKNKIERFQKHPLFQDPLTLLNRHWQTLDYSYEKIAHLQTITIRHRKSTLTALEKQLALVDPKASYKRQTSLLQHASRRLITLSQTLLSKPSARLENAEARLVALSPKQVLKRGYTLTYDTAKQKPITKASHLHADQKISLYFYDGKAHGKIENVEIEPNKKEIS